MTKRTNKEFKIQYIYISVIINNIERHIVMKQQECSDKNVIKSFLLKSMIVAHCIKPLYDKNDSVN